MKAHPNAIYVALAAAYVRAAVLRGDIPPPRSLTCCDCGKAAYCYDHRDYWKPLNVQPVCRQCNVNRGPGKHGTAKRLALATFARQRPDIAKRYGIRA